MGCPSTSSSASAGLWGRQLRPPSPHQGPSVLWIFSSSAWLRRNGSDRTSCTSRGLRLDDLPEATGQVEGTELRPQPTAQPCCQLRRCRGWGGGCGREPAALGAQTHCPWLCVCECPPCRPRPTQAWGPPLRPHPHSHPPSTSQGPCQGVRGAGLPPLLGQLALWASRRHSSGAAEANVPAALTPASPLGWPGQNAA